MTNDAAISKHSIVPLNANCSVVVALITAYPTVGMWPVWGWMAQAYINA
jgi:hypothetical protein